MQPINTLHIRSSPAASLACGSTNHWFQKKGQIDERRATHSHLSCSTLSDALEWKPSGLMSLNFLPAPACSAAGWFGPGLCVYAPWTRATATSLRKREIPTYCQKLDSRAHARQDVVAVRSHLEERSDTWRAFETIENYRILTNPSTHRQPRIHTRWCDAKFNIYDVQNLTRTTRLVNTGPEHSREGRPGFLPSGTAKHSPRSKTTFRTRTACCSKTLA